MPRRSLRAALPFLVAGLGSVAGVLPARRAEALSPYLVVPEPSVAEASAAYRYANMTAAEAVAELDRRKIPYTKADPIAGVVAPVRLTGKLHGIYIHSSIPESQRATSIYEVLDARLALALDDFAKILSRHDVEEVVHYSLYRPNVPREDHDLKETRTAAAPDAGKKGGGAAAKGSPAEAKGSLGDAKGSSGKASGSSGEAKGSLGEASGSLGEARGSSGAAKGSGAHAKGGGAPGKGGAREVKAGGKVIAALPALPAGKAFPAPASKGEHAGGHGAKQKAPAAGEKKANGAQAPAAGEKAAASATKKGGPAGSAGTAPSTKAGPARAAGHGTAAATGRGLRPHAGAVANKGGAAGARPRGATAARADSKASAPPKIGTKAGATGAAAAKTGATGAAAAKTGPTSAKAAPTTKAPAATTAPAAVKKGGSAAKGAPAAAKGAPATAKAGPAAATSAPVVHASVAHTHTHAPASRQTWAAPGTRHPAGLAIDVAMIKKRDGQWVSVATHFHGRIGDKTCGDGVRSADTPEARELRSIVCEANDLGVFTYVLTPNYNAAHYDHFHMEIRPQVKWFLYQ